MKPKQLTVIILERDLPVMFFLVFDILGKRCEQMDVIVGSADPEREAAERVRASAETGVDFIPE